MKAPDSGVETIPSPPPDPELADTWIRGLPSIDDRAAQLIVLYSDQEFGQLFLERVTEVRPELLTRCSLIILDPDPETGRVGWRRVVDLLQRVFHTRHSMKEGELVPCCYQDFAILAHPERMKSDPTGPDNLDNIALAVHRAFASYRANINTRSVRARDFFANVMWNATMLPGSVDLRSMMTPGGEPPIVVVIGGGPSHRDPHMLAHIRAAQRNRSVVVICCDRAVPAAVDAGVQPDLVCAIDINAEKGAILEEYSSRLPAAVLVCSLATNMALPAGWRAGGGSGMIAYAGTGQPEEDHLSPVPVISEPMSVGEFALDVAVQMKPRGVALVGYEFNDSWKGEGAGRPMRIGGYAKISIVFDAFVGAVESTLRQFDCPVWNYGYANGVMLEGSDDPWFPLDELYSQRSHLPIDHYDWTGLEEKLLDLSENPEQMLRFVCFGDVADNPEGIEGLTEEQRREGIEFIQKHVTAALDVITHPEGSA